MKPLLYKGKHIHLYGFIPLFCILICGLHLHITTDILIAGSLPETKTSTIATIEKQVTSKVADLTYAKRARLARSITQLAHLNKKKISFLEVMNIIKKSDLQVGGTIVKKLYTLNKENMTILAAKKTQKSPNPKKKPLSETDGMVFSSAPSTPQTYPTSSAGGSILSSTSNYPTGNTLPSQDSLISSTGSVSTGSVSTGSVSTGSVSTGSVSTGSVSTGSVSTGSVSTGSVSTILLPINFFNPQNPQLQKLAQYQQVMGGFVANHIMVFMNMPQSASEIDGASYYMANIANEFATYSITPIFIFEPIGDNSSALRLSSIKNGAYTANLELLFSKLKNDRNITEDKLGIIVPYPELNTPAFDRTGFVPGDFSVLVNNFFSSIRKYYPTLRGGLLLDSQSYDVGESWGQGSYDSFLPYISGINPAYIQTFGIQGFPWISTDGRSQSYNPSEFLPTAITEEAANVLQTRNVWMNTGTMKRKYQSRTIAITPEERTTELAGVMSQAMLLQSHGYDVLVHLFAQDKFGTEEETDWSYIENPDDGILSPHEQVLKTFIEAATGKGIKIGLFDN